MNRTAKTIIQIVLFALFIVAAVFAYHALGKKTPPQGNAGDPSEQGGVSPDAGGEKKGEAEAPDLTVFDTDGKEVRLSDFFGKPIVLNFWASWCSPCRGEMPEFNQAYEKAGEEITFMMVDLVDGGRETEEKGAQFVRDQGFSFPLYFDLEQEAARTYGINSIPQTFFIDKDGYIVARAGGAIGAEALQQGIDLIK